MADKITIPLPNNNKNAKISITSLAHGKTVEFFPYDLDFDDTYKQDWGSYDAFGRMDPIMTYKRTTRDVSISFNVVASTHEEALSNFRDLQTLIFCLYPRYSSEDSNSEIKELIDEKSKFEKTLAEIEALKRKQGDVDAITQAIKRAQEGIDAKQEVQKIEDKITSIQNIASFGVQVMKKSPLFQISFMNLLKKEDFVAVISNFKHKLKFDSGATTYGNQAIPGSFNLNISFKVIHTYVPGEGSIKLNYDNN